MKDFWMFRVGDLVEKIGGDYTFKGEVRSVFAKKSGKMRVVVENEDGILHIFNANQLDIKKPGPWG